MINYSDYTIHELLSVVNAIDRERYPERAEQIDKAMQEAQSDPEKLLKF